MAALLLVNGMPGTGKTTLAAKLRADLELPCIGKDMLKEFFFDTLLVNSIEESRLLGGTVSRVLYDLAHTYIAAGKSLMIESAFYAEFAVPEFMKIAESYSSRIIEIYCMTEKETRRKRFQERDESGTRHPGHRIGRVDLAPDDPEPLAIYAPLQIGKTLTVDTTLFGDKEYNVLLRKIRKEISHA